MRTTKENVLYEITAKVFSYVFICTLLIAIYIFSLMYIFKLFKYCFY